MTGALDKGATRLRARRIRLALWLAAAALSVGVVAIVGHMQFDAYRRMLGSAQRQIAGASSGVIRTLDQDIDASLGPLLALRIGVTSADPGPLQTALAEVHARHPELGNLV
ncbi:hypothetical protein, partial [Luteibacter sp.]|uniref:hypothetical protein n=1 Tax=Luteibacter sp. TaxID=1886636 RepID=UPI003F7E0066